MIDKYAKTALDAFKKMTGNLKISPKMLWTDEGKEFEGAFRKECDSRSKSIYHTFSDTTAAFVERAIRSLKSMIYRHLEETQKYNYLSVLQRLVKTLNAKERPSLGGKTPETMTNDDYLLSHYSKNKPKKENSEKKLLVGDPVRLAKKDLPFKKGYKPQFTTEVFIVTKVLTKFPIESYQLHDLKGELIRGHFYYQELIKCALSN